MESRTAYSLILSSLQENIKGDYILLDIPYYSNVGDVLIWQATLDLLRNVKHRCLYSSSIELYEKPDIKDNVYIVFLGGGNFGDLWKRHQTFRHKILEDFPNNPILQMSQSVWFDSEEFLLYDIDCFKKHMGPVTICLRDRQSFDFISKHYPSVQPLLMPDIALSLNISKLLRKTKQKIQHGEGVLFFQRNDKEAVATLTPIETDRIGDWPCMETAIENELKYHRIIDWCNRHHVGENVQRRFTKLYYKYILKDSYILNGIQFLMPYHTIYATRLHAAILADLLGKQVYIIDNSYGKCSGVFDLWMKDHKNVVLL